MNNEGAEEAKEIRSEISDQRAYLRLVNSTERAVEVIWVNFTGGYVCYGLLEKGSFIDLNTYKTHPWIAIDHNTKDRLHIEKEFVYYPKTTREYFQIKYPNKELPPEFEARIRAAITLPLRSLRYTTLLATRNYFRVPEEVDLLELPKYLIDDLKQVIAERNNLVVETLEANSVSESESHEE